MGDGGDDEAREEGEEEGSESEGVGCRFEV